MCRRFKNLFVDLIKSRLKCITPNKTLTKGITLVKRLGINRLMYLICHFSDVGDAIALIASLAGSIWTHIRRN